jgi:hypothetical protein
MHGTSKRHRDRSRSNPSRSYFRIGGDPRMMQVSWTIKRRGLLVLPVPKADSTVIAFN